MKKIIKNFLKKWALKNFPLNITTRTEVNKYDTIFVKKGKIREWRTYDSNGKRVYPVKM